jgi:DNA polymerase III subunit beta
MIMTTTKLKQEIDAVQANGVTSSTRKSKSASKSKETRSRNGAEPEPDRAKKEESKRTAKDTADSKNLGMQVICSQELLNRALTFVKAVTPAKPLHPVLANALIVAKRREQQVTLTVSDMALTVSATFDAQVEVGGEITLPVEVLVGVVSKCPIGNITLRNKTSVVPATTARSKLEATSEEPLLNHLVWLEDKQGGTVEIRGMGAEEFPVVATVEGKVISLSASLVKTGLKGVLFATSTDEAKKILTGMQWTFNHTQNTLSCTATDGYQVALVSLSPGRINRKRRKSNTQQDEITCCVIPTKALKELTRNLEKVEPDETLQFGYDDRAKRVMFELIDEGIHKQIICQCLEDPYPDCQALVNQYQYPQRVTVERNALLTKLDRLSVLADRKENGIRLFYTSNTQEIHLSIERDYGKGKQVVAADIPPEVDQMEIMFNINYLLNALKAISSSAVCITMNKPYTPVSLKPAGDLENPEISLDATYFVLPLYDKEKAAEAMRKEAAATA